MTAKEVDERLGKLIAEAVDDVEIVQILNDARIKLKNLIGIPKNYPTMPV